MNDFVQKKIGYEYIILSVNICVCLKTGWDEIMLKSKVPVSNNSAILNLSH